MQDAGKQRPYYGRWLVLFAHISRKNDANWPGWDGSRRVHIWPRPDPRTSSRTRVAFTWKMYPYNKCPSIVGTPLVCVLRAHAPNVPGISLDADRRPLCASCAPCLSASCALTHLMCLVLAFSAPTFAPKSPLFLQTRLSPRLFESVSEACTRTCGSHRIFDYGV